MNSRLKTSLLAALLSASALAQPTAQFKHRGYISPEEIRKHDSRTLARMVVERLNRDCEKKRGEGPGLADVAQIIMFVPEAVIDSIAKYGFKNQHQTQTSGGENSQRKRFETEQTLSILRMPYSDKAREILPKYAAFSVKNASLGTYGLLTWYGGVALVFKDQIHSRTTWTTDDSLLNLNQPRSLKYNPPPGTECEVKRYCEAQIWGPIDLSDIDYVLVREKSQVSDALRATGLPIKYFKVDANPYQTLQIVETETVQPRSREYASLSALTRAELEKLVSDFGDKTSITKNILTGHLRGLMTSEELLKLLAETPIDITAPFIESFDSRSRLFSELAVREKSPEVIRKLKEGLGEKDSSIRAQSLLGLSELPFAALKPLLLRGFADKDESVQAVARAIALDYLKDSEIKAAFNTFKKGPELCPAH